MSNNINRDIEEGDLFPSTVNDLVQCWEETILGPDNTDRGM